MTVSVATWNTEWATPGSDRGRRISVILAAAECDVIVVTEGVREILPPAGSVVDAGDDWGYGPKPARRKVILWSRHPMALDVVGTEGATRGRLAVASITSPAGPLRIVGVCIPWRDAHVNTGRGDASPWSEHMDYLDRLETLLGEFDDGVPTVIAGDFNQRIPRVRQPVRVSDRLGDVLSGWTIHTAGGLPNGPHIDHIATDRGLVAESVADWPASDRVGRLSDHAGVSCRLALSGASVGGARASATDQVAPVRNDTGRADPSRTSDHRFPARDGALPPELRAEMEQVLRRSGEGLSHGATFQLR